MGNDQKRGVRLSVMPASQIVDVPILSDTSVSQTSSTLVHSDAGSPIASLKVPQHIFEL